MEIQLFAAELERPLTDEEADSLLRLMPKERRARARNAKARQEPLLAYALLSEAARQLWGWASLPRLGYGKNGKPFFPAHPEAQFSISHTRRAVLVGLHDEPLGVDIERLRPVSERVMRRVADTTSQQAFFAYWVRREARSKRDGTGIVSLREPETVPPDGERVIPLDIFPDCAACLCTRSAAPVAPVQIRIIR